MVQRANRSRLDRNPARLVDRLIERPLRAGEGSEIIKPIQTVTARATNEQRDIALAFSAGI
jgi:hypothetical protein